MTTANRATAAGELRAIVAALLSATGHGSLVDAARLCTSEIVANVWRHTTATLVHVEVTLAEKDVTVFVYDDRPRALPVSEDKCTPREGGMGIGLVKLMTDAWGVHIVGGLRPHSKAVWFRLDEGGRGAG